MLKQVIHPIPVSKPVKDYCVIKCPIPSPEHDNIVELDNQDSEVWHDWNLKEERVK